MVFHIEKTKRHSAIAAGVVGNIMEWYDFALYGYMASILSTLFFPGDNKIASLLATYGVFAAGFLMRPLGSALFGWLGDTVSRSTAMFISVAMMAVPTFILGLLPTYTSVGLIAPVMLVAVRLIQGLSVGGEFSSSVTYLVETAPENRRGLSGSYANVGSMAGMLLGAGMAALVTNLMPADQVHAWGWRLPFLFGAVLGVIAIWLRRHLPRSSHFQEHDSQRVKTSPLKEAFTLNISETFQALFVASAYGALFYISLVFLPNWLEEYVHFPLDQAMTVNTISTALLLLLIPLMGWLSDSIIRRTRLVALSIGVFGAGAYPLLIWLSTGSLASVITVHIIFAILISVLCGVAPSLLVELFPTEDRLSGYSVAYNMGLGVVGGATPMICTWLISITGNRLALAGFMLIIAVIGLGALIWMKDRSREPLR
ncbi:MAG: MFS transporter [Thermodesulfobacteriota bacterium]|nr:MFS transporter [Thermodesulfobacteriota bacterium]